ncbi:MAG: hypothetical protein JSW61_11570 [Candidatus Thorarchaeota archaeon]|nr:MAG: hypothetical protein JSW61_11570 [Candidatus Thorarchaeota archaeon]
MKRLSLIDPKGLDRLLLRNPAGYRSGFWASFVLDDLVHHVQSTEERIIRIRRNEMKGQTLRVDLDLTPVGFSKPMLRFSIALWSYNKPTIIIRHTTKNIGDMEVEDMKVYNFMDFDLGGPRSYKDDRGQYDPDSGTMMIWDDNPLYVGMSSIKQPDSWEISPPAKLKVEDARRDLRRNLKMGPKDIASALQWNLGNLGSGEEVSVELLMSAGISKEKVLEGLSKGKNLFGKKLR